ncbi:hypothetical protein BT63DRAFT_286371 [Microthyrium microscopicum]|uniref:Uncharacterized protein n=1 Tax=Microthyrium microscopicum TaxID=703497 RepID=A0A6A6U988_9PEZI|nr:hypothetical protein BT63DRAFT_286371 [Microthyrium microscopicum]
MSGFEPPDDIFSIGMACQTCAAMILHFSGSCWAEVSAEYTLKLEKCPDDEAVGLALRKDQLGRSQNHPLERSEEVPENAVTSLGEYSQPDVQVFMESRNSRLADRTTRPVIAHLYKEGLIKSSYDPAPPQETNPAIGVAIALTEPGRSPAFAISYNFSVVKENPNNLVEEAKAFLKQNPGARFSILRPWSFSMFFPAKFGEALRKKSTFVDMPGRTWECEFLPKESPYSDWYMKQNVEQEIERYTILLPQERSKVLHRRDVILVMAENEIDCLRDTMKTACALQSSRLFELDVNKSFFNVDAEFLERMDARYLGVV